MHLTGPCPTQFTREMGITPAEFARTLASVVRPWPCSRDGNGYRILHPRGLIEIRPGPPGERRIAALRLPVMQVEFRFHDLSDAERQAFMGRFDRCFHRGGG